MQLDDNDDIFSDDFVSQRSQSTKPLEDRIAADHSDNWRKRKPAGTRKNKKREAPVVNRIRDHLFKHYGAVTTRVNSGQWQDDAGNTIRGAEAGTSDILACVPIRFDGIALGVYIAFECKAPSNKAGASDAQQQFIDRVRRAGGFGFVVQTVLDVDDAIAQVAPVLRARLARYTGFVAGNQTPDAEL